MYILAISIEILFLPKVFFFPKRSRQSAGTSPGLGRAPTYLRSEREEAPEGKPRMSSEEKCPKKKEEKCLLCQGSTNAFFELVLVHALFLSGP